jgi:putative tryptophan/tyrosine transport system substrate-binding protein
MEARPPPESSMPSRLPCGALAKHRLAPDPRPCFTPDQSRSACAGGAHEEAGGRCTHWRRGSVAGGWARAAASDAGHRFPQQHFAGGKWRPRVSTGLSESGYVEGQNISIEYRYADGNYDRLSDLAAELRSLPVSLIVAVPNTPPALALKKVTSTIPVIFFIGADPVQLRLVESYNRPAGNFTGIVLFSDELLAKRVELLDELLPKAVPMAFLVNPSNPIADEAVRKTQQGARAVGRELIVLSATNKVEIEAAFEAMARQRAGGLVVWQEAYFTSQPALIVTLAARHAIPAIYGPRRFAEFGGLMSYGANRDEMFRLTGIYAGRVLRGATPADLPVLQPTEFELVINVKAAKTLGLTVPPSLLARADEVIE